MNAIIQSGGKQLKVKAGDIVEVEKLSVENGAEVSFDVLAVEADDGKLTVGAPLVDGAKVTGKVLEVIKACTEKGVKIYTVKDRYVLEDTIQSKVLVTVMGLAAEIERDLLRQRTKEGLKRAIANGKTLGRPKGRKSRLECRPLFGKDDKIVQLRGRGVSFNSIARLLHVHRNTLARYIRDTMDQETRDLIGFGTQSKERNDD